MDGKLNAGEHAATLDAKTLTSGVCFYRITTGDFQETKKMLLVR